MRIDFLFLNLRNVIFSGHQLFFNQYFKKDKWNRKQIEKKNRKQKHGLYTAVIYIGKKANGYRILTITYII